MTYVFSFLVVANIALFGYMLFAPKSESQTLQQAKSSLQAPVTFQNTTHQLPPEIGKK